MVETFTPAVCGSRRRQFAALAGFALGAVVASTVVGAALGGLGGFLGSSVALAAAALALVAAAREAGILNVPIPQSRRQVPERWRYDLPLPVWSVGYGAGLGAGFLTFQPVSTFWIACAGAVALGRPVPAACCFAAYGAARALMAFWPRRGQPDATAAVETLARRRSLLLRVNAAALVVCAGLFAAPAAGAVTNMGPGLDPSATGVALARARIDQGGSSVLVEPSGESAVVVPSAAAPAVDGDLLAYDDARGITVVDWRTGGLVAQLDGAVAKPALDWPFLAFVRRDADYKRLVVADLTDPAAPVERRITRASLTSDLGRPSLASGRVAWHKVTRARSQVFVQALATGRRTRVAQSVVAVESNPSLTRSRVLWVEQRAGSASLLLRRLDGGSTRRIYRITGRTRRFWTTAIVGRTAYVARWSPATGASTLIRVNF